MVGYPGNKSKWQIPDGEYDRIFDLFIGGGGFSRAALRDNPHAIVFGAESNPIQRQFLMSDEELRAQALEIACERAKTLKLFIDPRWDGEGTYGEEYPEKRSSLGVAWHHLVKTPFDEGMRGAVIEPVHIAAQLLVGTYGYGANIRSSGNGLNVPPNAQKIRLQTSNVPARIHQIREVVPHFKFLNIRGGRKTIVLIDPPYVLPARMRKTHQLLTACYPTHEPYGQKTWNMYWDSISMALSKGAGTIVVAGYFSEEMNGGIAALAQSYGYHCEMILHKPLQSQQKHRHREKHGKRAQKDGLLKPVDCEWRLIKRERTIVSLGQLGLFEEVA